MLEEPFRIGAIQVEPGRNLLISEDGEFALEPRVMDVLCVLASDPGAVFARDALVSRIWKVEHGSDESLTRAVSLIRKAAREAGLVETIIETIPRKGYRLALAVEPCADGAAPVVATGKEPPRSPAVDHSPGRPLEGPGPGRWLSAPMVLAALGVVAIMTAAFFWNRPGGSQAVQLDQVQLNPANSIAVLPFEPFSTEPQDARFADGLTEDLTNSLSQIDDMAVAARTSALSYKGQDVDVREIGRALGVNFLLDGTVRRSGDSVRVTAQLVRASDGFVIWSDTMDEQVEETFALEDEIVREIGLALELRLNVGIGEGLSPDGNIDARAVEFYYEGLEAYANRFRENGSVIRAREALRSAVELEPEFAKAWVSLARIGIAWSSGPLARDKDAFFEELERDIEKAVLLAPNDPGLHATLVSWHAGTTLDLARAEYHLARARQLAPNAVSTLSAGATYHWVVGEGARSLDIMRQVQRRDPLSDVPKLAVAVRQAGLGQFSEAFEFLDVCQAENCLREGFIAYAAAAAIYSGDPDRMARWSDIYDAFEAFTATLPASILPRVIEVNGAFYSLGFGQADADSEIARVQALLEADPITDHFGLWAPRLASELPEDLFFELLETAYERGDLFSSLHAFSAFYGSNPYPDWVLEHPRYHALWSKPDLARLAAIRRENGQTAGLPRLQAQSE
ncbi:MAG: winged helix-turn-helix domain-containing protein [Pseudomonadota bacterium]